MPPQPPLLASNVRGYVCRSCLTKLQKPKHTRPPWLSRNVANDGGPQRPKFPKSQVGQQVIPEPVIKYWEQSADGQRREKGFEEEGFIKKLESSIKELEGNLGDTSLLEKQDAERELLEGEGEEEYDDDPEGDLEKHMIEGMKFPPGMESRMAELQAQIRWLEENPNLDNISEEDRLRIRNEVLNGPVDAPPAVESPSISRDLPNIKPPPQTHSEDYNPIEPEFGSVVGYSAAAQSPESLMISLDEYPGAQKKKLITYLNSSLLVCFRKLQESTLDDEEQKATWNCYLKCRPFLLDLPEGVPDRTWSLLWDIFEQDGVKNFGRLEHIFRLGRDMQQAGIQLSAKQHVLYIESQFVAGYPEEAISEWEEAASYGEKGALAVNDYWSLGVRMYAQNGDGENALDTFSKYLSKGAGIPDFRLLVPVIRGYLSMENPKYNNRAWSAYRQLLYHLGTDITMEDYDAVTSLFQEAGLPEMALDVFTDMMLRGENPSRRSFRKKPSVDRHAGTDLVLRIREELPVQKSTHRTILPSRFLNKFFFGKYIKKLIGDGQLDAAKQVFDLMGIRGICPDARHLNGLIGAFYRDGSLNKQQLAEDLAWRMISTRLEFVEMRGTTSERLDPGIRAVKSFTNKTGIKGPFQSPRATIETFTILIEQYRRRQKQDLVPNLLVALQQAQIPPNTHFMNQLLMTNMASPQGPWAWDTYRTMFTKQKVNPDFDTFTYFWELMRTASNPVTRSKGEGFVDCRTLFYEMIQRSDILCRKEMMPRGLYDIIIASFSLSLDQAGTAIALRALQRRFGLYPDENTARTIVLQLSKLGHRDKEGRYSRRLQLKKKQTRDRVTEVTKILATFKQKRSDVLLDQGINFDDLSEEAKQEEALLLLTDVLKFVAQSRLDAGIYGEMKLPAELSRLASEQMGVLDCDPWAVEM